MKQMDEIAEQDIFALIREDGFRRLVAAFYRRVPTDPVLSTMYAEDELAASQERLGGFLIQRFGGPDAYSQKRGHPRLRMRHARFAIGTEARDHWLSLMTAAMDEVGFAPAVRAVLDSYFLSTANSMMNAADG
jgi:hemoglobin